MRRLLIHNTHLEMPTSGATISDNIMDRRPLPH